MQLSRNRFSVQAFRITEHGRILFPRAWGRDPYLTFQKPERLEGQGDSFSLMGKIQRRFSTKRYDIRGIISYGMNNLTDPADPKLNKYALPSHRQLNAKINIKPTDGVLQDFSLDLFWTYKYPRDDKIENINPDYS